MKQKCISLWIVFVLYLFCVLTMEVNFWMLLSVWGIGLSVYLLIKNKFPSKRGILLSVFLAVLVFIAYIGYGKGMETVLINGLMNGIPTLICSLAVCSVAEKKKEIRLISKEKKGSVLLSFVIAVAVGGILSVINYFLMKGSNVPNFEISIARLLVCFSPAIYEEMVCRAVFMVFCLCTAREEKISRFQRITMWFMMCVPHTVAHGGGIVETVVLCICFGVPFAILQKKRDITSAMISHGLVDAVRFTLFGLGM